MYIPDWAFVRELKRLDAKLSVRWLPGRERWGIYREVEAPSRLYSRNVLVKTVEGPGRSYRPLDQRTLDELRWGDVHTRGRRIFDELITRHERAQQAKMDQMHDDHVQIAKEIAPVALRAMEEDFGANNMPRPEQEPAVRQPLEETVA